MRVGAPTTKSPIVHRIRRPGLNINPGSFIMATDRNTQLKVLLLGLAGILLSVAAVAEDRILITVDAGDGDVLEKPEGAIAGGGSFISGATVDEPQKILFGPDGNLYVLGEESGSDYAVYRYDGTSGDFIDIFIPTSSGLRETKDMLFGPDGNLYITVNELPAEDFCNESGEVWRFDGATGAFDEVFVANGDGNQGVDEERICEVGALAFMAAGDLLVGNQNDDSGANANILRFDGTTGDYVSTFVSTNSNGLYDPEYMIYGPDGHLYVSLGNEGSTNENSVLRFIGTTGAFDEVFVSPDSGGLDEPKGLAFGSDGNLYVVGADTDGIFKYDGSTGDFISTAIPPENSNLQDPRSLLFIMRVAEIPVMDPWAMVLLAMGLVGLAGFVLVRRKRSAAA